MCEIKLFGENNITELPEQCEVRHGYHNNAYFEKLQLTNSFIYWIATKLQATLVCQITTFHSLQGTGILTVPTDCIVYTPTTILISIKEINKTIDTEYCPEINLLNIYDLTDKIKKIQSTKLPT